jgi:hypothetical protein
MSQTTFPMRELARQVLARVPRRGMPAADERLPTFHAIVRLRPQLAVLVGNGGMRALLLRALVLAGDEIPWLRTVRVDASASLVGLDLQQAQLSPKDFLEGKVLLLAQVFSLMETFIGEAMTLRLVQEAWPEVPVHGSDFGKGDET